MNRDELFQALRNADAAGDSEAARKLAEAIQGLPDEEAPNVADAGVSYDGTLDPGQYSAEERAKIEQEGWTLDPTRGKQGVGLYIDPKADQSALPPPRDDSAAHGFGLGLMKPLDNLATWVRGIPGVAAVDDWAAEKLGMQNGAEFAASNDAARANNSRTGFQMAGNIASTLPLAAMPGGVLAQGAAGGALLSDAKSPTGLLLDAGLGAAGGKLGDLALRGAATAIAPRLSQSLRTLIDAGVDVTPGQMARAQSGRGNSMIAAMEDKLMSVPVTGDAIKASRRRGFDQFGQATINRALEPIGETLPANISGRRAVQHAGDRLSAAYDAILPRLSATGDAQFVNDLAAIHSEAANMLPARQEQFNRILGGLGRFWQSGSTLDGRALKEIETRIGERVRRAAMSTDADQRELGDRLGDVLASVRELAARQNPAEADALRKINTGWKSLTQVERAAGNTRAEIAPAGYSQAVKQSSDTVRRRGYARGEALNQDLADAASDVLPSETPDSGTAGRLLSADMLNPLTLATVAATYPGFKAAQGATKLLSRNPTAAQQQIADLIRLGAPLSAAPGAAVTTGTIHSLTE